MKVVINDCFGGFGLSDAAVERCLELGMKLTIYGEDGGYADPTAHFVKLDKPSFGQGYYPVHNYEDENAFRCNPILIQAVEELGEKADGKYAKLKVVYIPFETTEGWHVSEYDGSERIEEDHRTWG